VFERFTTWGRQVVIAAQDEARELRHAAIGPDHLLLGLLRAERGLGGEVLRSLGFTYERARAEVEERMGVGDRSPAGQIPYAPPARQVLEQAMREAMSLGHEGIAGEHVLLALGREGLVPGVDGARVRDAVLGALDSAEDGPGTGDAADQAEVVLGVLAAGGPVADLLRERGVTEAALRTLAAGGR
jgi:ATP-dependent Clp protease ATP-binding subunit ClpA